MIGRGNRSTRRKPAPVPLCPPQTPHAARTRTRAAAVGSHTKDKTILLLLTNHQSHISLRALDLAKENGVVLQYFPSYTTYKLQPSDRSIYGPLTNSVNNESNVWLRSHPGKNMTIHDSPSIPNQSLPNALTPMNTKSRFFYKGNKAVQHRHIYCREYLALCYDFKTIKNLRILDCQILTLQILL
jgi:hypothetical protein